MESKKIIAFIFLLFNLSGAIARESYLWEEENAKHHGGYYLTKMEKELGFLAIEYLREKYNNQTYHFAGPTAFGLYGGEKVRLQDFWIKPDKHGFEGFKGPKVPMTPAQNDGRMPIDRFDFHTKVFVKVISGRKTMNFPIELGLNFMCDYQGKRIPCRKSDYAEFFDHKNIFVGQNYVASNSDKNIVGIYHNWRPYIREVQFEITSKVPPLHQTNIFEEYKEYPEIIQAIRHRFVIPNMTKEHVELAIGQAENLGITIKYQNNKVKEIFYDAYKRSPDVLD